MNSNCRKDVDSPSACPSSEALREFLEVSLGGDRAHWVERHLESCESCLARAEEVTSLSRWMSELHAFNDFRDPATANAFDRLRSTWPAHEHAVQSNEDPHPTVPKVEQSATMVWMPSSDQTRQAQRGSGPATAAPGGRFQNLQPIGRGGCATVFRADDTALGRMVALKFPHPALLADPRTNTRFLTELRATAALHHPHIVALHDAGLTEQQGYIVFEYVAGPTLSDWLGQQHAPVHVRTAAAIVARLADGVQHAHEAGILHRDLKPSNVLLDESRTSGELPFVPRIADFGIARFLNSDVTHTIDDVVLGSPPFMSPEQALGDRDRIGPASDVYALGGILYQLLTNKLPIQGASAADTLRRVLTDDPVSPRRQRPDVPRDLEAICLKCLAKPASERYPTARALQQDLERFLAGEAVSVRPPRLWERAVRTTRRYPAWTALAATIAATVMVVLVLLSRHSATLGELAGQLHQKNAALTTANTDLARILADVQAARDHARRNETLAQQNERRARETVYAYDLRQAFEAAEHNDARMVQTLLGRYADGTELADYRGIEWHYLWRRILRQQRQLLHAAEPQYLTVLSPDRATLAIVGKEARVRLLDWPSGTLAAEWPTGQREVNGACFSADGTVLWTAGDDGTVCQWDRATHERKYAIDAHTPNLAYELVYDAPRQRLVSCGREGTIRVWDAATGAPLGTLEGHADTVETIQLHPDGRRLVSISADQTVRLWDLSSLSCETTIPNKHQQPKHVAFSPDGRWLAIGWMHMVTVVDLSSGSFSVERAVANELTRLCFDDSSQRLFVGHLIGVIDEWALSPDETGKPTWNSVNRAWLAHADDVYHLTYAPQTRELISAGRDGQVLAWSGSIADSTLQHDVRLKRLRDFIFVPQRHELLIASEDGVTRYRRFNEGELASVETTEWRLHSGGRWNRVAAPADGRWLAAGGETGRVAIWNHDATTTDAPLIEVQVFDETYVSSLTFRPDGRHLYATARGDVQPQWIDVATGLREPLPFADRCAEAAFSVDGSALATVFNRSLRVLDWPTRRLLCELPSPSVGGRNLLFLPDGRSIAIAIERKVRIHDVATGQLQHELLGHNGSIWGLSVSPDGRTLASAGGNEGLLKLWHVPTGQHLADLRIGTSGEVCRCAFSHDGAWLAYTLDADTIRVIRLR